MLRLACLLLSLIGAPSICSASDAVVARPSPVVTPANACKGKASESTSTATAAATDAPARNGGADGTGSAAQATVRRDSPRWNRLLPGMFR